MVAEFAVGDWARVQPGMPSGHCRIPGYLRGKPGRIVALVGVSTLADEGARGVKGDPQPLYTVQFAARDVWPGVEAVSWWVSADLWESYLERCP